MTPANNVAAARRARPSEEALASDTQQFLRAPALFRWGPASILAVGVTLSLATLWAGQWRVVEGRKGEYEKAFVTARLAATAATENLGLLEERLAQATDQARALQRDAPDDDVLADRLAHTGGLRRAESRAFGVTPAGRVLPLGVARDDAASHAGRVLDVPAVRTMEPGTALMLPMSAAGTGDHWTVAVHRLEPGGRLAYVVHLLPETTMLRIAQKTLGPLTGRVLIVDGAGSGILQASNVSGSLVVTPPDPAGSGVSSVAEAMATPLDFESARMITASAQRADRTSAAVGLREREVLTEFDGRVRATWLIIGLASAGWMGMAAFVAYALWRFKRTEAFLRRLATTDLLTDLPNRRSFHSMLTREVGRSEQRKEPLALLLIDLDNFKDVNDAMGHPVGDELLRHVAQVLQRTLRPGDRVCRLGGDEFTVLVRGVGSVAMAHQLGDRILHELRALYSCQGVELEARGSIGAALMPLNASNETDLMRFADTALHRAKQDGKGRCIVYDETMAQQALQKAQTVRELERGIAHDELFLVYQPKYHLATGTLTGHEALVRWKHPVRGTVFPNDFIPLAESSGLIAELGDWVLRRAVRQVREWREDGKGWHKVAVNVSQLQLKNESFVAMVEKVLRDNEVPGRCLQVEITESCLASDAGRAGAMVRALRRLGVTVAVDDFGTGYSSLSTLGQFEIDTLKVDRSFINAILTRDGLSICRAIVGLGQSLEMNLVAEGVESLEQAVALAQLGCNEVQGYLYSKPVAAEVAVGLLKVAPCVPDQPVAEEAGGKRGHLTVVPASRPSP